MDAGQSAGRAIDGVERFRPTSGRFTGAVLVVAGSFLALVSVADRSAVIPEVGVVGLLAAVLGWAAALRPRVSVVGDNLELRTMLQTVTIPLAAVEELVVRQVLVLHAGDQRFTSPALGRKLRALMASGADAPREDGATATGAGYAQFVEDRLRQRMKEARAAHGVRPGSVEQSALAEGVRRELAWPEIAALVGSTAAVVLVILL